MKQSKYNVGFNIEKDIEIIYNTLSKKYFTYSSNDQDSINILLENLGKDKYDLKEIEILKELISKEIIINDDIDEFELIKFKEVNARFGDQVFYLTLQPTLDCNFRCTYCYEEHKNSTLDDDTVEKLLKFVDNITKRVNRLEVGWFGGEPLLQIDKIIDLTNKFKEICKRNKCDYRALMTTNGYLLSDRIIEQIDNLCIKNIQITLDGPERCHDKQRPLIDGTGTFHKIKENVLNLLSKNVNLVLRINITKEIYPHIHEVFDIIPKEKRKNVTVQLSNLMQDKNKMNLFEIYKIAIDKGFKPFQSFSTATCSCEAGFKNSFIIEPNGIVSPCSGGSEDGLQFGELDYSGNIKFKNKGAYYKFKNTSPLNSDKCKKCIQLPMCMGGCLYSRYKNPDICNGLLPDGLSLHDKIRLHYYRDLI